MAKRCDVCGKEPRAWHSRTYSNKAVNRWFKPNIIKKTIVDEYGLEHNVKVCAKCYKKLVAMGNFVNQD